MRPRIQLSRKEAAKHPSLLQNALNEFCVFADAGQMSPEQRAAWLAYWYASMVRIGGHREFFLESEESQYEETIQALRAVGATEQAEILAAAIRAALAASKPAPAKTASRPRPRRKLPDFTQFDDAFERCSGSVRAALLRYLDNHEAEFIDWKP